MMNPVSARFLSELDTRLYDEHSGLHKLLAPLIFYSAELNKLIIVPTGFITDFASVPRIVGAYLLFGSKGPKAAVVHDWLYSGGIEGLARAAADRVFLEALKASGYSNTTSYPMYWAVRIGGGFAWTEPNLSQPNDVADLLSSNSLRKENESI